VTDLDQGKDEYETGRWSKAYRLFQKALEGRNDSERQVKEVRLLMARCLVQMGEPDEAETTLKDVQAKLSNEDKELVEQFETAWREVEDTRKLGREELERRRAQAESENS
jgi:thioredoxin-like negative regulator of GroEL